MIRSGRTPSSGDIAATLAPSSAAAGPEPPSLAPCRRKQCYAAGRRRRSVPIPRPNTSARTDQGDIEAVEPVHVLGRVYAMQKDGGHDCESESRRSIGQDTAPRKSRGASRALSAGGDAWLDRPAQSATGRMLYWLTPETLVFDRVRFHSPAALVRLTLKRSRLR